MASYRYAVGAQAPLQMQLGSPLMGTGLVAKIREVAAFGESLVGTASDPILGRPSTVGDGIKNFVAPLNPGGPTSAFPIIYSFSSAPTHPTPTGAALVAQVVTRRYVFPKGSEFIVYSPAAALLYATSSGGHTFSGEICWEEM